MPVQKSEELEGEDRCRFRRPTLEPWEVYFYGPIYLKDKDIQVQVRDRDSCQVVQVNLDLKDGHKSVS